jgi:hypothetical protein
MRIEECKTSHGYGVNDQHIRAKGQDKTRFQSNVANHSECQKSQESIMNKARIKREWSKKYA